MLHDQEFIDDTLRFVEVGSLALKQAMDEVDVHRSGQKRAAALRPELLELMLKTNTVATHQKQAAEAMLASHDTTLQLLKSAVEKLVEERKGKPGDLGRAVPEKQAGLNGAANDNGYDSLTDPFLGRRTSQKKASDLAIEAVLQSPQR